ncbi:MAG: hypothetical protein EOO45_04585 [Flavobacterium sp.]|nr:MAG: hypothetical protein EOO45_04585 [Flavobacterium sp.]
MKFQLASFLLVLQGVFTCAFAQSNGVLPLTGIQYFNEGISARYVEVAVDGARLISNRIPANKEFAITLQLPTGYDADASKKIYPAAEVTVLNNRKQVLAAMGNVMKEYERSGFAAQGYNSLTLKVSLLSAWLKNEPECIVQVRYYDLKSKKQLRVIFPVSIATPGEALAVSKIPLTIKSNEASLGMSNALTIQKAEVTVDTSIRVAPKNAYLSIDMPGIKGTSMTEVVAGKYSFWVYDAAGNEIKIADKLLKKVGGSMEDDIVNLTVKIPFRLKTDLKKTYIVRFRWEGADKKKVIDMVATR